MDMTEYRFIIKRRDTFGEGGQDRTSGGLFGGDSFF